MTDSVTAFEQHPLWHFLQNHPCGKSRDTITKMCKPTGKWSVPDEEYETLLDLLHDYLFVKKQRQLGFVERPRPGMPKPLLIDLDFQYKPNENLNRRFTKQHIDMFCRELIEAYKYFFDLSQHGDQSIRFFVLLRPQPYESKGKNKEGPIKDGIHIVSPEGVLTNEKWNVIRNYLNSRNIISNIFGGTGYINEDSKVFDPAMGNDQGWFFYGASKPDIHAYELKDVLHYFPDTDTWEEEDPDAYKKRELLELMSIRYNVQEDKQIIREEKKEEFEVWLHPPQTYEHGPPSNANTATTAASNNPADAAILTALASMLPPARGEVDLLRQLVLECLTAQRADDHDQWMRVGWCLHNINPSDEMFDLWMEFTKKSPKWEHHRKQEAPQLRRDWHRNMRKEGDGTRLSRRSLYKWARDDNLERYKQIIDADVCEYIIQQTDTTHYHIACLMKKMWDTLYVASVNNRNTDWFYYDEVLNMWRKLNQGMELRQKICHDVANQIQSACDKVGARFITATGSEKELLATKMKQLHDMQVKLYNSGFSDSVMKYASVLFYDEDFVNKLNINPYLFGCSNGVLELRHKGQHDTREHVIFRQGRPEDYLSFLAGRNFPETEPIAYTPYDPKDPRQLEIQEFFRKLFPREDLRKHVLKILASCLEGLNREQLYYFFIGVGSNGKSKLVTLMELTLGDYQTSLQATVLTRKRPESGAANPDIMAMKNRRFIYSQEPDDKESLNTSRMKQLSGEDMVEARGLFQDQEKFRIMGKMFMMCNSLPPIHSMDNGTWRRIRVIPFESRFEEADHPDLLAGKPNFYPRDNKLSEKLLSWREPFLSYLVHIYETEYIPHGLQPEPLVIKQESERYKADHDIFAKFRMERIRERRDGYDILANETHNIKVIKRAFDRWAAATSSKRIDMKELERRCEEAFGDSRGRREYSHIRVFMEEEDVEEFDRDHQEAPNVPDDNVFSNDA